MQISEMNPICSSCWFRHGRIASTQVANAGGQPSPKAEAEQTLEGVGCSAVILMEAPSLADHRGLLSVAKTLVTNTEETSIRFYTTQHPYDCGIDRHTRTGYVCILNQAGETLLHRHMPATPQALLKAIAPDRDPIVMAAEWNVDLGPGWLTSVLIKASLLSSAMPFYEGHPWRPGQHTTRSTPIQSPCCGAAGGSRRRLSSLARCAPPAPCGADARTWHARGGELLAHGQHTNSQDHRPAIGKDAYQANRDGVTERFTDPAVQTKLERRSRRIGYSDELLCDLDLTIVRAGKPHDANT